MSPRIGHRIDPGRSYTAERIRKEAPFKILQEERDERGYTFTIEGGKWDWYMGWFLSFGDRITIIDPDELRSLFSK